MRGIYVEFIDEVRENESCARGVERVRMQSEQQAHLEFISGDRYHSCVVHDGDARIRSQDGRVQDSDDVVVDEGKVFRALLSVLVYDAVFDVDVNAGHGSSYVQRSDARCSVERIDPQVRHGRTFFEYVHVVYVLQSADVQQIVLHAYALFKYVGNGWRQDFSLRMQGGAFFDDCGVYGLSGDDVHVQKIGT